MRHVDGVHSPSIQPRDDAAIEPMMILDSISVVGKSDFENERMDVCSETVCTYDQASRELVASLESFLRRPAPELHAQRVRAAWLPRPQIVREHAALDEASDLARDIAASWCHKVSTSVPDRLLH